MGDVVEQFTAANSEGSEDVGAAQTFSDAPVVQVEAPPEGEAQKLVPPLPANAEEGPVVRTAGPSAQATIEANVGVGNTVVASGIADGALGQHTKGENEPVEAMAGVVTGMDPGALG